MSGLDITRRVAELREHGFTISDEAESTVANLSLIPAGQSGLQLELHAGGIDLEVEVSPGGNIVGVWLVPAAPP